MKSASLSALLVLQFTLHLALAAPRPAPAAVAVAARSTPTLPTISYNIGPLNQSLTPILGIDNSTGNVVVGGIGEHDLPGVAYEHGNGEADIGSTGIQVCLTQTFIVGVCLSSLAQACCTR